MILLPRRKPTRVLIPFLHVLTSFTIVISVTGAINTASAADKPKSTTPNPAQTDQLEIPGSFKDPSDAKDPVTAKRSPEEIGSITTTNAASIELKIDAEKAAVSSAARAAKAAKIIIIPTISDTELVDFNATAYCLKGRTASGVDVRPGMIAADPRVLPLGTVVHLRSGSYTGTYKVTDTGGLIRGRRVDVYVATHKEAIQFGRRQVKIKVLGRSSDKTDRASKTLVASEQ
jgi:3D (Asp-Asp-Asp) domain-containing protein